MKTITTNLYTLAELKQTFPDGYKRAFESYQRDATEWELPWSDEIHDSWSKLVDCLDFKAVDWQIGAYAYSSLRVRYCGIMSGELEDVSGGCALAFVRRKLRAAGFKLGKGPARALEFNGDCPLTGYCGDDDAAVHVWKALLSGDTLKEAVQSLADWARESLESECEYQQSEEAFVTWADGQWFTEDGEVSAG